MEERKERHERITITRPVSGDPHKPTVTTTPATTTTTTTLLQTSPNYQDANDANSGAHSSSLLSEKQRRALKKKKRKKLKSIGRKHPEFELTYDMMLGIRYAVSLSEPSATTTRTHTHTHTHTTTTNTNHTNSHTHTRFRQRTQTETETQTTQLTQTQTQTQTQPPPPVLSEMQSGSTKLSGLNPSSASSVFGEGHRRNASQSLTQSMLSNYPSSESDDESDSDNDANQLESEFLETKKYRFPAQGSETTPAHQMSDFRFKDYCPQIFRQLREWFRISTQEYLLTICGDFKLLEFISNSKSGQFFFFSHNSQFIIKTMSRTESIFLRKILPSYYTYVSQQPDTLLPKFFGMHRVKSNKQTIYFLIQQNVFFCDVDDIHEQYDLKGSTQGRRTTKDERSRGAILKDLDWMDDGKQIKIGSQRAKLFKDQLKRDTQWLRTQKIMDYSLLVGLHYRDRARLLSEENDTGNDEAQNANASGVQVEHRFEPELQTVAEDVREERDNDDDADNEEEEMEMQCDPPPSFKTLSNMSVFSDGNSACITPFHAHSSVDNIIVGADDEEECKYPPSLLSAPRTSSDDHSYKIAVTPNQQRVHDAEEEEEEEEEHPQEQAQLEERRQGLNFMIKPSTTEYTYSGGYDSDLDGDKVRSQSAGVRDDVEDHFQNVLEPNRRSSAPALVSPRSTRSAPSNHNNNNNDNAKSKIFTFDTPSYKPERQHLQSQSLRSDDLRRVLHDPDATDSCPSKKAAAMLRAPSSEQMYPLKSNHTCKKLTLSSSSATASPMYRGHISVKNPKLYKRKTALEWQFAPEAIALPIGIADANKIAHLSGSDSPDGAAAASAAPKLVEVAKAKSPVPDEHAAQALSPHATDGPRSVAFSTTAAASSATAAVMKSAALSTQSLLSELTNHTQTTATHTVATEEETDAADSGNNDICPWTTYHGGMVYEDDNGEVGNEVYFVGLIDILQKYNKRKKLENWIKKMKYDKNSISAAPPDIYAQRMCDFFEDRVV